MHHKYGWSRRYDETCTSVVSESHRRVFPAIDRWTGERVGVKVVADQGGPEGQQELQAELAWSRRGWHPRVVPCLELCREEDREGWTVLTRPWVEGPTLAELGASLDYDAIRDLMIQVLEVVEWLHEGGWQALDLKAEHLIRDAMGRWMVVDVGQAHTSALLARGGDEGTWAWSAPEILGGEPSTPLSDLYAVGLLLDFSLRGCLPPGRAHTVEGLRLERLQGVPLTDQRDSIPSDLVVLHMGLLSPDPTRRQPAAREFMSGHVRAGGGNHHPPELLERQITLEMLAEGLKGAEGERGGGLQLEVEGGEGLTRLLRFWADLRQGKGDQVVWLASDLSDAARIRLLARAISALSGIDMPELLPETPESCRDWTIRWLTAARACGLVGKLIQLVVDLPRVDCEMSNRVLDLLVTHLPGSGVFLVRGVGAGGVSAAVPHTRLPPLSLEATHLLCDHMTRGRSARFSPRDVLEATEGRVALVMDFLQQWREDPHFEWKNWHPGRGGDPQYRLLQGLTPQLRRSMELAALAGTWCERVWWEAAGGEPASLPNLLALGVLTLEEGGLLVWCREGMRREVLSGLSVESKQQLASDLAEAATEVWPEMGVSEAARLAQLLLMTQQRRAALHWLAYALKDGQSLPLSLRITLRMELLAHVTPRSPARYSHLVRLGAELSKAQRYPEVVQWLSEFEGEEDLPGRWEGRAHLAIAYLRVYGASRAEKLMAETLQSGVDLPLELRVRLALLRTWMLLTEEKHQEARQCFDSVVLKGGKTSLPPELRLAHTCMGVQVRLKGGEQLEPLAQVASRALAEARELGFPREEGQLLNLMSEIHWRMGDRVKAANVVGEVVELARRRLDLTQEAVATFNHAGRLRELGEGQRALGLYERAALLYARLGDRQKEVESRLWHVDLLVDEAAEGVSAVALTRLEEHLAELRREGIPDEPTEHHLRTLVMRHRMRWGADSSGEEIHQQAADMLARPGSEYEVLQVVATGMEMALVKNRPGEALRWMSLVDGGLEKFCSGDLRAKLHQMASHAHRALSQEGEGKHRGPAGDTESELVWLRRIGEIVEVGDDPRRAADAIVKISGEALHAQVLLHVFGQDTPDVIAGHDMSEALRKRVSSTVVRKVARTRQPVVVHDILEDEDLMKAPSLRHGQIRSVVGVPVVRDGICLAVLYAGSTQRSRLWTERAERLLTAVASITANLLSLVSRQRHLSTLLKGDMGLVGHSPAMSRLRAELGEVCYIKTPGYLRVFLMGETGVGKSLIARALHHHGRLGKGPFEEAACPAVPDDFLEALFYGYRPGFTRDNAPHIGYFGSASGGTLFLDEVADLALHHQAKLLVALSDGGTWRRLGDKTARSVDFDLISGSNKDMTALMEEGVFRRDLWRRLSSTAVLTVPTLRQRGEEDILDLLKHFQAKTLAETLGRQTLPEEQELGWLFTQPALDHLRRYDWPYNVSQLQGMMESASVRKRMATERPQRLSRQDVQDLLERWTPPRHDGRRPIGPDLTLTDNLTLNQLVERLDDLKRSFIQRAVQDTGGNIAAAARKLGCTRETIHIWLRDNKKKADGDE